jgi:hypothetical protein
MEEIDFSKQQYRELKPLFDKIVAQQMRVSDETAAQGKDYYDYQRSFRPIEQSMMTEAMGDPAARADQLAALRSADEADSRMITGSNKYVYDQRRSDIEQDVGRATADVNQGYSNAMSQNNRALASYGINPNSGKFAGQNRMMAFDHARSLAGGANMARSMGIQQQRGLAQAGMGVRRDIENFQNQQMAIDWAKKLDAAGLVKGLPGASAGAYGLAVSSGNSAGQNAMAPGSQYSAGLSSGANTTMSGQQMKISGLSNVLNNQTSMYNTGVQANGEMMGAMAGGAMGMFAFSDVRMKENIVLVGTNESNGLNIYEFNYIGDDRRFRGVIAQEVEQVFPDAVFTGKDGRKRVNYAMLGMEMEEV